MVRHSPEATFYLLPFRAWELLLGSVLAMRTIPPPPSTAIAGGAVTAGIAMILAAIFFLLGRHGISRHVGTPSSHRRWVGNLGRRATQRGGADFPAIAPLVYIGRISYSLYLVHWPVLFFANRLMPDADPTARTAIILAVSVLLADLSYRFVETPTRKRGGFWTPTRIFGLTAASVVAGVGLSFVTIVAGGFPGRLPADAQQILAYRYDRVGLYREGSCFLRREQDYRAIMPECLPTDGSVAVIWGDSHAAHFVPGLKPMLEQRGYRVAQITASGCPPIPGFEAHRRPNCRAINDFAFDWIRQTRPSLVILSAIWTLDGHLQSFEQEIAELGRLGVRTMILGPSPVFPDIVPVLLAERRTADNSRTSWALPTESFVDDDRLRRQFSNWPADYVSIMDLACPAKNLSADDRRGAILLGPRTPDDKRSPGAGRRFCGPRSTTMMKWSQVLICVATRRPIV